ncbi:glycosyltransferase family 2 protein [Candidatus Nitrotoga fabula]|uniref:Glyco_trans_2-like domain-containing protein n=1 Tax=Candidatus Nitrotoga fabula TaxID=2182327 RepID=A0A916BEV2_9PROT|nr:glycosyltransferase family 2 protein [Candidatus Nitrotoga fabula]CAE6736099.1 Glyco_trans_2-like domain-containing protein [Candidatus Nitrotoga fabula]
MIDVCICTHNPRMDILSLTISGLANQNVKPEVFRVILIDNHCIPPLSESILLPLIHLGIPTLLIREPKLGLQHARIAAIRNTTSEWVLWLDDDNEPTPNFIQVGLDFIHLHPEIGCFGGKLLLPEGANYDRWLAPFLPYLGIKNPGEELKITQVDQWTDAEPPGASAWVHRKVLNRFLQNSSMNVKFFKLDRNGKNGLASCGDSMMMRGAVRLGLSCAYVPALKIFHHIDLVRRSKFFYLIRLMYEYGKSHVILESLLKGLQPIPYHYQLDRDFFILIRDEFFKEKAKGSLFFGIGMIAYHLGVRSEHIRQHKNKPTPFFPMH